MTSSSTTLPAAPIPLAPIHVPPSGTSNANSGVTTSYSSNSQQTNQTAPQATPASAQPSLTPKSASWYTKRVAAVITFALGLIGLALAFGTGIPTLRLAKWTVRNDFFQSCLAAAGSGYSQEQCNSTIEMGPVPPPVVKRTIATIIWYTSALTDRAWVDLLGRFRPLAIAVGACICVYTLNYTKRQGVTVLAFVFLVSIELLIPIALKRAFEAMPVLWAYYYKNRFHSTSGLGMGTLSRQGMMVLIVIRACVYALNRRLLDMGHRGKHSWIGKNDYHNALIRWMT